MEEIKPSESTTSSMDLPVMKKFTKSTAKKVWPYILGSLLVVLLGVGTGWLISGKGGKTGTVGKSDTGAKVTSNEAGVEDVSNFSESAEGLLEAGGVGGEGTHHLTREGGPSKTVRLTSTVLDLEGWVGQQVTVWGETLSSRGGWLMDVGKVKIVE